MNSVTRIVSAVAIVATFVACDSKKDDKKKDGVTKAANCFSEERLAELSNVEVIPKTLTRSQGQTSGSSTLYTVAGRIKVGEWNSELSKLITLPESPEVSQVLNSGEDYQIHTTIRCSELDCKDLYVKYDVLAVNKEASCTGEIKQVGLLIEEDGDTKSVDLSKGSHKVEAVAGEFLSMDELVAALNDVRANPETEEQTPPPANGEEPAPAPAPAAE